MKTETFLLCEDIRAEIGNKFSLMGILGDQLIFTSTDKDAWPRMVNLAAFVRLSPFDGEFLPDAFELELDLDGEKIGRIAGNLNIENNKAVTNIPINLPGVLLKKEGKLNFHFHVLVGDETMLTESKTLKIGIMSS